MDAVIEDLGRVLEAAEPGEGDGEPRSKELLRHRAPLDIVVGMLSALRLPLC